jgi:hypothetical protein
MNIAFSHKARQSLSTNVHPSVAQVVDEARESIGGTGALERHLERVADRDITLRVLTQRSIAPRIIAADRDLQHTALR